ncbi:MAG TPA: CcmD family protein [Bacteroidia bacterium]|nr:CcmD family protein [Bacteroidia bacterium]
MNRNHQSLKVLITMLFLLANGFSYGQGSDVEMADLLHENGKIYVVILVIAVILAGFILNLILVDRRLRKLEKKSGK